MRYVLPQAEMMGSQYARLEMTEKAEMTADF
jgi:hypothetical protein